MSNPIIITEQFVPNNENSLRVFTRNGISGMTDRPYVDGERWKDNGVLYEFRDNRTNEERTNEERGIGGKRRRRTNKRKRRTNKRKRRTNKRKRRTNKRKR